MQLDTPILASAAAAADVAVVCLPDKANALAFALASL